MATKISTASTKPISGTKAAALEFFSLFGNSMRAFLYKRRGTTERALARNSYGQTINLATYSVDAFTPIADPRGVIVKQGPRSLRQLVGRGFFRGVLECSRRIEVLLRDRVRLSYPLIDLLRDLVVAGVGTKLHVAHLDFGVGERAGLRGARGSRLPVCE